MAPLIFRCVIMTQDALAVMPIKIGKLSKPKKIIVIEKDKDLAKKSENYIKSYAKIEDSIITVNDFLNYLENLDEDLFKLFKAYSNSSDSDSVSSSSDSDEEEKRFLKYYNDQDYYNNGFDFLNIDDDRHGRSKW